jgi:hypothetical protein
MKVCHLLALAPALATPRALAQGGTDLNSGGLAPPEPVEAAPPPAAPTQTEETLTRADREDSGRGLEFFWLNAELGGQHVGLQALDADNLVDGELLKSSGTGLAFGGGAGVRLIFLTFGARFDFGTFESWQLWTLNAEAGFRIPLGELEPYFTFGGGYASLGGFDAKNPGFAAAGIDPKTLAVRGFDIRGSAGLDYFIGHTLSVGANLSGDLLFLSRSKVAVDQSSGTAAAGVYGQDGSGIGAAGTLMAVVGLHF